MLHVQILRCGLFVDHYFHIFYLYKYGHFYLKKITVENYINYDLAEIGYIPTTSYIAK